MVSDNTQATFFDPSASVAARAQQWLQESSAAGVPWRTAAIIAAISNNETAAMFRVERAAGKVGAISTDCFPSRLVVTIEEGNPAFGTQLHSSWTGDPDIMKMLRAFNALGSNGTQLSAAAARTDSPGNPNDLLAKIFEWLIDKRKAAAIGSFSIGPTQTFLAESALAATARGKTFSIPSYPVDFDELWAYYTAPTTKDLVATKVFDYLPTGVASYPTSSHTVCESAGGNSCVETYLQNFQTGPQNWASSQWNGYALRFQAFLQNVWNMGRQMKYTPDPLNDVGGNNTGGLQV